MAKVIIPSPYRKYADNKREIEISAENLADIMARLVEYYSGLKVLVDQPLLLSVFINGRPATSEQKNWNSVQVRPEDEISLIIPIAGG